MPYEDSIEVGEFPSRQSAAALATTRVGVVINSSDLLAAAAAGGNIDGFLYAAVDAASVETTFIPVAEAAEAGGVLVRAGGTCTAGADAMVGATAGKFVDWTAGNVVVGRFETGTTTDGDLVRMIPYVRSQRGNPANFAALSGDGAITPGPGSMTYFITKGSAAAITIADPTATTHDGSRITVVATTAFAHTLSNAAGSGFNAGGAATDVGTFGGAKGDNIVFVAYQGKWYVESKVNVTLG